VKGKPYLLHFWATWCGPCKADLPRVQALAEKGLLVLGMHPAGTPAADVEKAIRDYKLTYPTFLASKGAGVAERPAPFAPAPRVPAGQAPPPPPTIAGYPAGMFPYCVLVDAEGRVAAHGLLSQMLPTLEGMVPREKTSGAKEPAGEEGARR
jgi:thiol-disulfide isomerase/thioredoxin